MYISLWRWKPFTLHVALLGDFAMSSHLCSPEKVFLKGLYPAKDSGGTFLKMSQTLHKMTLSVQHMLMDDWINSEMPLVRWPKLPSMKLNSWLQIQVREGKWTKITLVALMDDHRLSVDRGQKGISMFQTLYHGICNVDNTVLAVVSEKGEGHSLPKMDWVLSEGL